MDEKKELEKIITETKAALDVATKKLAELEKPKPKLRHGDYGVDHMGRFSLALDIQKEPGDLNSSLKRASSEYAYAYELDNLSFKIETKFGNIIDDFKRNSEDLRKFRVTTDCYSTGCIEVVIVGKGINFEVFGGQPSKSFTLDEATEIRRKLGQVIATAKREQDGK